MKIIKQISLDDFEKRFAKAQRELNDSYSSIGVTAVYLENGQTITERRLNKNE